MTNGPIQRIVIVGGGTAGWMTAAGLSRVLAGPGMAISLIESPEIGTVGVGEATIPPILGFNRFVGLDERLLLRDTAATFKLGIEFDGWHRPNARYFHPFGEFGVEMDAVPFQHWRRSAQGGFPDLWTFSLETRAAMAGRFAHRSGIAHPLLGQTAYAYHFDAAAYAAMLRMIAERRGVNRIEGRIERASIDPANGHIASVELADGRSIGGDLFIDCSGFRSLLLGETLGVPFVDWNHLLPCDRAWAVQTRGSDGAPYTRSIARTAGWQWRIPLQHRTGNGHVFSSAHVDEQAALDTLLANLPAEPSTDPRRLTFRAGHRACFWQGNCVGIGLAGGFLEPLESTSIHLIQLGILRLIGLFPDPTFAPSLIDEYNREMAEKFALIRDFLLLHYRASERTEPFWRDCRAAPAPDRLAHRIDLYRASGVIPVEDADLFKPSSWLAVMEGQGISAQAHHPLLRHRSDAEVAARLQRLATDIGNAVSSMPAATDYVAAARAAADKVV